MAERVESFPSRTYRRSGYPWNEWLDGGIWRIELGDHNCRTAFNFRTTAYGVAAKRGLRLRTVIDDDDALTIQAFPAGGATR